MGNYFVETHPESYFRKVAFAGLFTSEGRVTLLDELYTERVGETVTIRKIPFGPEWADCLRDVFGIALELGANELERLKV